MTKKLTVASVLAFERKLDFSDVYFSQANSANCFNENDIKYPPVLVQEKSVKGTISNRLKKTIANDPEKVNAEVQKANLQRVDVAMLNDDCDTLVANFSVKVLPFNGAPYICNNQEYKNKVIETAKSYIDSIGFSELAKRYAHNILSARWLWRNRMGAKSIKVTVTLDGQSIVVDDALALSLMSFKVNVKEVSDLAEWISEGLQGVRGPILLNVEAKAIVGVGQEVYPSQELVLDRSNTKSKILYSSNGKAAMHSQKTGSAIRCIDTWYDENAKFPIAAEPFGSVTNLGMAFRQPKSNNDFYTLFDEWVINDKKPSPDQQHFVMAVLIRGGVFGASAKE